MSVDVGYSTCTALLIPMLQTACKGTEQLQPEIWHNPKTTIARKIRGEG